MLQMTLNRELPFSRCFSGGGDVAEIDKPVGFHQHGLYFDHAGKLLVDHPYNAEKLALLKKLGMNPDETKPEEPAEALAARKVLNPEVVKVLEGKTDAELAEARAKLVGALTEAGTAFEAPAEGDRDGLIRFIAEHLS